MEKSELNLISSECASRGHGV